MLSGLPTRWRLTLAFAIVMAAVLAATGVFVHGRLASNLDASITRGLNSRAADVAALAQQSEHGLFEADADLAARGRAIPALAQLVDARGHVVAHSSGLPARALLAPAALARVRDGQQDVRDIRLHGDHIRLIARSTQAQDQRMVVIVGESLEARTRALDSLLGVLLIGGPVALLLASFAGYLLTGAALAPVEAAIARERTFVADASHELRSPLAMLRTELELLGRERSTGAALQRAVGSAIEETDRVSRLTDDLLLLARAEDRQLALTWVTGDAGVLMRRAAARAADPRVRVDAAGDAPVLADPERIGRALDNLLSNARRYADERIVLAVRIRGDATELHVVDDGPGFPADFLPRAWERFARADSGRTEEGTGLGLAIVRTIAELHGGSSGAQTPEGGGADVWITLRSAAPSPALSARGTARHASRR